MSLNDPSLVPSTGFEGVEYEVLLGTDANQVRSRDIRPLNVRHSYDIESQSATFMMWDANSVVGGDSLSMPTPKQADDVVIRVRTQGASFRTIFRGKIISITDRNTPEGRRYTCTAAMLSRRINEFRVTLSANVVGDPFRPQPQFNPQTGDVVTESRTKTLAELVRDIMDFPNAWGLAEGYSYSSIDWGGLDSSPTCGGFRPSNVSYENTPKGEAIQDLLQRAGNFYLHYDPESDRFRVVEVNLACNRCGPEWPLRFTTSPAGNAVDWSANLQVLSDQTEWSSSGSVNGMRVSSGPIRFYSGHFVVPEMIENATDASGNPVAQDQRLRDVGKDTVDLQIERAKSWSFGYYRFQHPVKEFQDGRKYQQHIIGAPMFPDWNPLEDYLPDQIVVQGVSPSSHIPSGSTEQTYTNLRVEVQPITRGQVIASGALRLGMQDNLRVYQAWHTDGKCPACNGSGAVLKVYDNTDNTPEIEFEDVLGGKTKRIRVTNYLFDPLSFGDPDADTSMLTPFPDGQGYPVPWKHLCPACRGVGWKPIRKIRNIQSDLFRGKAIKVDQGSSTGAQTIPSDPQFTQAAPETFDQSQNRSLVTSRVVLSVETSIDTSHRMPVEGYVNSTWKQLSALSESNRVKKFPHPLHGFKKRFASVPGTPGTSSPEANLIPSESLWNEVTVPFTTIKNYDVDDGGFSVDWESGRVIFQEPVFVKAEARFAVLRVVQANNVMKIVLKPNGLAADEATLEGPRMVNPATRAPVAYWRPARVWMQFFYNKDKFYSTMQGQSVTQFQYTSADGVVSTYSARAMVVDGSWVCDIFRVAPSTWGSSQLDFGNSDRPVMGAFTDRGAVIETTEGDLYKMPVPPTADASPEELVAIKSSEPYSLDFPEKLLFRWESPSPGERLYEMEGLTTAQASAALKRPRLYKQTMRDDRPRLLAMAVRRLESSNDYRVSGSLQIKGYALDFSNGLGYIDYPGRRVASVIGVNYEFESGFIATLEVTRQEARLGEMPPDDRDKIAGMQRLLIEQQQRIDELTYRQGAPASGGAYNRPETSDGLPRK